MPLSRRHFLLTGAAVTGAGLTGLSVTADAEEVQVDRAKAFTEAAGKYDVPVAVLAAFSYAQTRWIDHGSTPSTQLGYGPMHLVDGEAAREARARADKPGTNTIDTLALAAEQSGFSTDELRKDPKANLLGGAAVLATLQARLDHPIGTDTDPSEWYAAAAAASGIGVGQTQLDFADHVMTIIRDGADLKLAGGERLRMEGQSLGKVPQRREVVARTTSGVKTLAAADDPPIEAPDDVEIEWIPAPYESLGPEAGDYGNHDLGFRPEEPKITHIVVHDTEGAWEGVLAMVQDPTYVSWQYSLRSEDGLIAQHLDMKDVGWHAGNWYLNTHSIGLEHEGYAAQTAWTTEAMYRTSASLVRHLCDKFDIPKDRGHIIGHDQVPGILTENIPGMHWDPGPFFDWEHYFDLIGAPLDADAEERPARVGDVVRILPGFAGNSQPLTNCDGAGDTCENGNTNFVTLRVEPSPDADLVNDLGLHQKGQEASTEVSDISARAAAGTDFVVADIERDWTAIWYLGVKAWFRNPEHQPTAKPLAKHQGIVGAAGATAHLYGRAYPEEAAYENPDEYQVVEPLLYELPPGQAYAVMDPAPQTGWYKAKTFSMDTPDDHVFIAGEDQYHQISYGHRISFVRAEEVVMRQQRS